MTLPEIPSTLRGETFFPGPPQHHTFPPECAQVRIPPEDSESTGPGKLIEATGTMTDSAENPPSGPKR